MSPAGNKTGQAGLGIAAFEYGLPTQELLSRLQLLGVRQCELVTPGDVTPAQVADVGAAFSTSGVRVTAVASLTKLNSVDDPEPTLRMLDDSIECAGALKAPFVITYFGGHPERSPGAAVQRFAEQIQPSIERAASEGVTILIENHFSGIGGDVTASVDGCRRLLETVASDHFALNLDACNFSIGGEDPVHAAAVLREHVRSVHVKDGRPLSAADSDYTGRTVEVNGERYRFVPVGEGITDNTAVMERLLETSYSGPVTIEAHTPTPTLDDVFRQGMSLCRRVGITA